MSDVSLPVIGQEPWGEDLNAYIAHLEAEIDTNTGLISTNTAAVAANTAKVVELTAQVAELAAQVAQAATYGPQIAENTADIEANQASIANLNADLGAMFTRLGAIETQLGVNTSTINSLGLRISALENRPEFVFGATSYMFSSSLPPATGNQIRLNNATPQQATMLDIRRVDADGADRTLVLEMLTPNTLIRIQDWDNATHWYRYRVTGPTARAGADNFNVPVVWHSGAGTVANAKVNVGLLIDVPIQ